MEELIRPSFYRRELPPSSIHFNSAGGRKMFLEAVRDGTMECYYPLSEQFVTQAEPAYCAISTLTMCLNALAIDPQDQWRKPWRWFSEEIVECCRPLKVIQQEGMTFKQFSSLAKCNGAHVHAFYAQDVTIDHFRDTIVKVATTSSLVGNPTISDETKESTPDGGLQACLAVSYSRKALNQTGDGHMSPIGGYHKASDSVLILDVARFKYPPHWVTVEDLWNAMLPHDSTTNKSRGYCVFSTQKADPCFYDPLESKLDMESCIDTGGTNCNDDINLNCHKCQQRMKRISVR